MSSLTLCSVGMTGGTNASAKPVTDETNSPSPTSELPKNASINCQRGDRSSKLWKKRRIAELDFETKEAHGTVGARSKSEGTGAHIPRHLKRKADPQHPKKLRKCEKKKVVVKGG